MIRSGVGHRDHNKVIAEAARGALEPLGLRRKGRSRVWLDDNDWWIAVVEFQPSSFARGSYLNVGAMWLWRNTDHDHIHFGVGHRIDGVGFVDAQEDGFENALARMAAAAADQVGSLRRTFPDMETAAAVLEAQAGRERGWALWDAAVAHGLCGSADQSATLFAELAKDTDDRDWWVSVKRDAADLAELVRDDHEEFSARVEGWMARYRDALGLPAVG